MMTASLAGEGGGEGFGVEVIWPSIPPEGREPRVGAVADLFPRAGSPGSVRLISWEVLGIPDISSTSSRIQIALLTAMLTGGAVLTGAKSSSMVSSNSIQESSRVASARSYFTCLGISSMAVIFFAFGLDFAERAGFIVRFSPLLPRHICSLISLI